MIMMIICCIFESSSLYWVINAVRYLSLFWRGISMKGDAINEKCFRNLLGLNNIFLIFPLALIFGTVQNWANPPVCEFDQKLCRELGGNGGRWASSACIFVNLRNNFMKFGEGVQNHLRHRVKNAFSTGGTIRGISRHWKILANFWDCVGGKLHNHVTLWVWEIKGFQRRKKVPTEVLYQA